MGTIEERGDYQFRARVRKRGVGSFVKTFETKAEAELWIAETEASMVRGSFVDTTGFQKTELRVLLDQYIKKDNWKKKGAKKDESVIKLISEDPIAKMRLPLITQETIYQYMQRLSDAGLAAATVSRRITILSVIFNAGIRKYGYRGLTNPCLGVERPKAPPGRTRRPTRREIRWLRVETKSEMLRPVLIIAIETAMRRGEMSMIGEASLDRVNRILKLRGGETKSGYARDVPLSRKAFAEIEKITDPDGGIRCIKPDSLTQAFGRARTRAREKYLARCKRLGLRPVEPDFMEDLHLHDLRHDAVSRLFEDKGLEQVEVMSISGHRTTSMLKRYSNFSAKHLVRKLD